MPADAANQLAALAHQMLAQPETQAKFAQLDQILSSPLGGVGFTIGYALDLEPSTQNALLNLGSMADGLTFSRTSANAAAPRFTGAQRNLLVKGGSPLLET